MTPGTPQAEISIDMALVARLLADQHPDLADLPLCPFDTGWDNVMFRLGDQLVVRLPRRAAAAALIRHEQQWLPQIAERLTLPIPVPWRIGRPAPGYPWYWSIAPWLKGAPADDHPISASQAPILGAFLRSLHVAAPAEAPANPVRGVPLSARAAAVEARMANLAGRTDLITAMIRQHWQAALAAPIDLPPTWLHGDLHPRNILLHEGRLSGVIDWGDITAGDRATDLAAIWMLCATPDQRERALAAYGAPSEATRRRALGWAILFGVMLLDTGLHDHPIHAAIGRQILHHCQSPAV
ncbi:MAG TPA: aminoglycoside phosphotransferase family protein [Roseiflexaceae bacterium]|nr:aminoglycoside phosphotransferase family protein [Roseiflexaceae bacterium]HMP42406.1 aminoglycoside phosphotransferase family protein [Roseiflexaceae bacterium]